MKICITTIGSTGDVQPILALATGLREAGHDVLFAAMDRYEERVRSFGVPFKTIGRAWDDAEMEERFRSVMAEKSPFRQQTRIIDALKDELKAMVPDLIEATRDVDLVVSHPLNIAGVAAARVNGKPMVGAHLVNFAPSRAISPHGTNLGSAGNAIFWRLMRWITGRTMDASFNEVVRAAGLEPWRDVLCEASHSRLLNLIAISPSVYPSEPRWGARYRLTGYWFLPEPSFTPSAELASFVSAERPVVITFGSMPAEDARAETKTLLDGVRGLGRRVILQAGWAQLGAGQELPDNVMSVGFVPHEWLFSRAACVVHHGGAGTTGAALRAGVPSAVVWHMADQPIWGKIVERLGAGPPASPQWKLTSPRLRKTLERMLTDETMQARARSLGERIRQENGVARAIEAIEDVMRRGRSQGAIEAPAGEVREAPGRTSRSSVGIRPSASVCT